LDQLADRDLLVRVHGGAVPRRTAEVEPDLTSRRVTNIGAKRRIAQTAAALLPHDPHSAVLVDAGTPPAALLPPRSGRRGPVLPGRVRPTTEAAVGSSTVEALRSLHPAVAFLGCNGLDDQGFTTPDPDEAAVKTAMVRAAGRTVMLADSTKIGARHLVTFAPIADVDVLVTDAALPAPLDRLLGDAGIEVRIA